MQYRVFVTPHALTQWRSRVNTSDSVQYIASLVRLRLKNQIRMGLRANSRGAFELDIVPGLTAVMGLDVRGWSVITFLVTTPPEKIKLPG